MLRKIAKVYPKLHTLVRVQQLPQCKQFRNFSIKGDYSENKQKTNSEEVNTNIGLNKFVKKTYAYTGGGIASTLGIGIGVLTFPELHPFVMHFMGGGFVMGLAGCFGLKYTKYTIKTKIIRDPKSNRNIEYPYAENSIGRQISYGALTTGMGLCTAPLIAFAGATDILLPAVLSTSLVFGGATWYAANKTVGELEPWGPALHGGLWGLVGCSLTGLVSTVAFGPNVFSSMVHSFDLYAGIPLFAGLIAYDTHSAIQMYKEGDPDHLGCSAQLYLDFVNVLVRMIELMAKLKKDD